MLAAALVGTGCAEGGAAYQSGARESHARVWIKQHPDVFVCSVTNRDLGYPDWIFAHRMFRNDVIRDGADVHGHMACGEAVAVGSQKPVGRLACAGEKCSEAPSPSAARYSVVPYLSDGYVECENNPNQDCDAAVDHIEQLYATERWLRFARAVRWLRRQPIESECYIAERGFEEPPRQYLGAWSTDFYGFPVLLQNCATFVTVTRKAETAQGVPICGDGDVAVCGD